LKGGINSTAISCERVTSIKVTYFYFGRREERVKIQEDILQRRVTDMIWNIVKKSALDLWDEMLFMIVFNVIWFIGTIFVITWPFVTFGLFYTVRDVGEGRGIHFSTFFSYAWQMLKPAYIWGGTNLALFVAIWFNLTFYAGIEASWAVTVRLFIISLTACWIVLQLIMLALYPRLVEPSFRLALRNAAIIVGRYPLQVVLMLAIILSLVVISVLLSALAVLITFSVVAILVNNLVDIIVNQELDRQAAKE
jgi:hypothetical protein